MQALFVCCRDCEAPRRYPGCGATCPEYQEDKHRAEALRAARAKVKKIDDYWQKAVSRSKKRRGE